MRHHKDQDKNFLIAAMAFISKAVLTKAKKYLSVNQKESLDLFICKKLCKKEKPRIAEKFFDWYFAPKTDASERLKELLGKYEIIDKVGMFYAPHRTTVECKVQSGKITFLKVTPHERQDDVVLMRK